MILARIGAQTILRMCHLHIPSAAPIDTLGRRPHGIKTHDNLFSFIVSPGRVAGLRNPDFGLAAVLQQNVAHPRDLCVPSVPPEFERSREAVNTDGVDMVHDAAFAHEPNPLRVHRAARAEHGFLPALPRPMSGATYHLTENPPVWIERHVPFRGMTRLVPELDPFKMLAKAGNENVQEIGVLFRITRRRTFVGNNAEARRGVMKTGQYMNLAGEARQQPFVPFFAVLAVPIRPRDAGSQFIDPDRTQIDQQLLDPLFLAGTQPFQNPERRAR